jgi:hypothetical protein
MIPTPPRNSAVDVYPTRKIIHGATSTIVAAATMRSATGGRRRSVKKMLPIAVHPMIWSAYKLMPYHGQSGITARPRRTMCPNSAGTTMSADVRLPV